jgi:hypothetical protein
MSGTSIAASRFGLHCEPVFISVTRTLSLGIADGNGHMNQSAALSGMPRCPCSSRVLQDGTCCRYPLLLDHAE